MNPAYAAILSFVGAALGALITAYVAFRLEQTRMAASVQARWDQQLLDKSIELVRAARTLRHLAERYTRSANLDLQDEKIDDAHQDLRVLTEQLRIVGNERVQLASRMVQNHAYAVRVKGEDGHDPRVADFPGTTPTSRLNDALQEFYRAVRVQLRAPDAEKVIHDDAKYAGGLKPLPMQARSRKRAAGGPVDDVHPA
jgi:hypothetical protein